jgi:hypothetical protein
VIGNGFLAKDENSGGVPLRVQWQHRTAPCRQVFEVPLSINGARSPGNGLRMLPGCCCEHTRPLLQPEHDVEKKEKPDQPSDGSALRDASLTGSVHRYEAALPTGYRLR